MNINLKNKTAVVCGSTQGIGKAIAIELAALGANITLFARNNDAMKKLIKELNTSAGQEHTYISADFRFPDQVQEVITNYTQNASAIHILINNQISDEGMPR